MNYAAARASLWEGPRGAGPDRVRSRVQWRRREPLWNVVSGLLP